MTNVCDHLHGSSRVLVCDHVLCKVVTLYIDSLNDDGYVRLSKLVMTWEKRVVVNSSVLLINK